MKVIFNINDITINCSGLVAALTLFPPYIETSELWFVVETRHIFLSHLILKRLITGFQHYYMRHVDMLTFK